MMDHATRTLASFSDPRLDWDGWETRFVEDAAGVKVVIVGPRDGMYAPQTVIARAEFDREFGELIGPGPRIATPDHYIVLEYRASNPAALQSLLNQWAGDFVLDAVLERENMLILARREA